MIPLVNPHGIVEALQAFCRKQTGPHFHPAYRETTEAFAELLAAEHEIEEGIQAAWARQARLLDELIAWDRIQLSAGIRRDAIEAVPEDWWDDEDRRTADDMRPGMERGHEAGGEGARQQTGGSQTGSHEEASRWSESRSLEQSKSVNGTTRARMRRTVAQGISEGWSANRLADAIRGQLDNPERAEMIARTESIRAYSEGSLSFARAAGAGRKEWLAAADPCPICEELDGMRVGLDEEFPGGYSAPPDPHPSCRCALAYVFDD